MPSVEYDSADLLALAGKNVCISDLEESIPMMGVDMASIDDERVELEVFPNRPDLLSIEGFARALRGFMGLETGYPEYGVEPSQVVVEVDSSVEDVRPAVSSAVVKSVDMSDEAVKSIMDVQEKLHLTHGRNRSKVAIGVHDLAKVKAPITYKAVKPGSLSFTPLEMNSEMNLEQILVKHPKGRDYAHLLEGKKRYPVFVDAKGDVLSFPPVINSELTKLTDSTRDLFIELTGTDQCAVDVACNILVTSLAERGAKICSVEVNKK